KHRTEIGRRAFVGSNSALVAPVRIGAEAIVGAGSTITRDVPDRAVAVARGSQQVKPGRAPDLRQRFARRRAEKAAKE
ncbi:MAG TPA: bifunctional UDP-N-acetylglucosamine diphosphorylase/glucosamine-1-phosphate N-acetyltransferase GlmU, partial [Rhodospirillales bacterium]|nr:bifunctional UDP-N-acetylglucosamine diphosphorylase/glucosamine-1-phosphate N-acetyltransferase GlmU [Rhodospirillales bacterium]